MLSGTLISLVVRDGRMYGQPAPDGTPVHQVLGHCITEPDAQNCVIVLVMPTCTIVHPAHSERLYRIELLPKRLCDEKALLL